MCPCESSRMTGLSSISIDVMTSSSLHCTSNIQGITYPRQFYFHYSVILPFKAHHIFFSCGQFLPLIFILHQLRYTATHNHSQYPLLGFLHVKNIQFPSLRNVSYFPTPTGHATNIKLPNIYRMDSLPSPRPSLTR